MPSPTVLVLNDDRCVADSICRGVREVWPHATIMTERSVNGARQQLGLYRDHDLASVHHRQKFAAHDVPRTIPKKIYLGRAERNPQP